MGEIRLSTTPYGRPAAQLLRERISQAKADDPLRPVTVVVPTNYVGVSTRRQLAAGTLGPITQRGNGIAGLTLLTVYRLAELLGAPALAGAGRRPVSTPVVAAAVRQVLAKDPGCFSAVATHPSTEEGLVRSHRELSELRPESLAALRKRSRRAADVVRIHEDVRTLLGQEWFDEADLMASATAKVAGGTSVLGDIGTVLVYLPQMLSLPAAKLLIALADHTPVEVIAARTGVTSADAETDRTLRRLGLEPPASGSDAPMPPAQVISVSDAEEEVRTAVEKILGETRVGTPLERMAVLYPSVAPYARLVHEQLVASGINYNGRAVRPLSDRVLGRWLLDLLSLADQRFSRPAVMALLSMGPMRGTESRRVSAASWERVSREAGIVRGAGEWQTKLTTLAEDLRARAAQERTSEDPRDWRIDRFEADAATAEALRAFATTLFEQVDAARRMTTWRELAAWATAMLARYLGDERRRADWPDVERAAAQRVEEALDRLATLDGVEPVTDLDVFRRTLELELDTDLGRVGSFGQGVLVGTLSAAIGLDLDVVIVLGLAEGVLPTRPREDSLLPDSEREVVADELPLRRDRTATEHRQLLAALASAERRILVYPRGDLRRSMERVPSRWLLDCCAATTGERVLPDTADWFGLVRSFYDRVGSVSFPATRQEYGLRALRPVTDEELASHPLVAGDGVLARGVELLRLRGHDTFTRFDGNLSGVAAELQPPDAPDRLLTATQLESWLSCPHAYFMQYVLQVKPIENPEELLTLDAMERGSLMHGVLEEWLKHRLDEGVPSPDEPWSDAARRDMRALAEKACDTAQRRGITGHPLLWERDREVIVGDLLRFVDHDDRRRAKWRLTPLAAERPFGMRGAAALVHEIGQGTTIRLRGQIDRVDRADDGTIVVADYKTGGTRNYKNLKEEQPLGDGTKLQLALYGLALVPEAGDAGVRSEYWFTSNKSKFERIGYPLTDGVIDTLNEALQIIVGGMRRGMFPLKPAEPGFRVYNDCRFCDPDDLGTTDRYREWETIRQAPELRDYVSFIQPNALAEEGVA